MTATMRRSSLRCLSRATAALALVAVLLLTSSLPASGAATASRLSARVAAATSASATASDDVVEPGVPLTDEDMAHLNELMSQQVHGASGDSTDAFPSDFRYDSYSPTAPASPVDDDGLRYVDTYLHSQVTLQFDLGDRMDYTELPTALAELPHDGAGAAPAPASAPAAGEGEDAPADGVLYKSFEEFVGQQKFRGHIAILQDPSRLRVFGPTGQAPAPALPVMAASRRCALALSLGLVNQQSHSLTGTLVANGTVLHRSRTEKGRRRVALGIDSDRRHAAVGYPEDEDLFKGPASAAAAAAAAAVASPDAAPAALTPTSAVGDKRPPVPPGTGMGVSADSAAAARGPPTFAELLTGVGWLVRKGQSFVETATPVEGLDDEVVNRRGPRAALGWDDKGHFMVLVVEGSRKRGTGLDLYEFTDALMRLNFHQAVNLGGDGGRALVVRGSVVNSPQCARARGDPPCLERDDVMLCLRAPGK